MKKNVHVTPVDKGKKWSVKTEKSKKAYRTFDTQKEAINAARTVAINNKSELLIHSKKGTIREKNSYGNDKYPPQG